MTASTVSAASDKNNSHLKRSPSASDGMHMERNTLSIKEQTDGSDKVINKTAGKIKKEEGQPVSVSVCARVSQRPFV